MSYALVKNCSVGDFFVVDKECLSDSVSLGSNVNVYASPTDHSTSYEALLIDFGAREAMERKELEIRDFSLSQIKEMIQSSRSSRRHRAASIDRLSSAAPTPTTTRKAANKASLRAAAVAASVVAMDNSIADTSADPLEDLDSRDLLRGIYRLVDTMKRDMNERMEKIENDMTAVVSHIELSSAARESDGIKMSDIAESLQVQEEIMAKLEKDVQSISQNMIRKMPVRYHYMPEEEVAELDREEESITVFAGRLSAALFSEDEQFMRVDDRDQSIYNWIVNVVARRRAASEQHSTKSNIQSRIRHHLNQQAKRLRDEHQMIHPDPVGKRKKQDRMERQQAIEAAVEERTAEVAEKRRRLNEARIQRAANQQLRKTGVIANDGEPILFVAPRPVPPPSMLATPAGRATSRPNSPMRLFTPKSTRTVNTNAQPIQNNPSALVRSGPTPAPGTNRRLSYPRRLSQAGPTRSPPPQDMDEDDEEMPMLDDTRGSRRASDPFEDEQMYDYEIRDGEMFQLDRDE